MSDEKKSYRPGSGKKYDPKDPHFNPMHPPEGYPDDLLWKEWFGAEWEQEKAAWEQEKKQSSQSKRSHPTYIDLDLPIDHT